MRAVSCCDAQEIVNMRTRKTRKIYDTRMRCDTERLAVSSCASKGKECDEKLFFYDAQDAIKKSIIYTSIQSRKENQKQKHRTAFSLFSRETLSFIPILQSTKSRPASAGMQDRQDTPQI